MLDSNTVAEEPPNPVPGETAPAATGVFVFCCVVLPILWGVLVHAIFRRLRATNGPDSRGNEWPDYQI